MVSDMKLYCVVFLSWFKFVNLFPVFNVSLYIILNTNS